MRTRSSNTSNSIHRKLNDRGTCWDECVTEDGGQRSKLRVPAPTQRARRPLSRRALVAGALPVAAAAIGAVGALAVQYSRTLEAPGADTAPTAPSAPAPATAVRSRATPVRALATPTEASASGTPVVQRDPVRELRNVGVPEGMALVASPRLPLAGVGPEDPWSLLTGRVRDWSEVGSAVSLPVNPVSLNSELTSAMRPGRTF